MIDGVAQDVIERCFELVEDIAIDVGGFAAQLELNALAQLAREIAHQTWKALHAVAEWPHAADNHFVVQPAIQIVGLARMRLKFLNALGK